MYKIISIISFALIVPLIAVWLLHSSDYGETLMFSRDKKPVVTTQVDELFGTETESTEWVDGFWLGLLPADDTVSFKAMIGVVPIGGFLVAIAAISLFFHFRKRKKSNS